ncbi:MAG: Acetyltransferase family protein [uncultured bacterium]|nr:MAG: Acetyltransferase family protein [uncultured bacterium]HBH19158.1 GNAT family N-acetyltransferase [Cyanobacteria bacterium UBA9579]
MNLKIEIVNTQKAIDTCIDIRRQVFIVEQNVSPEEEADDLESIATHFLAYVDEIPAGTARLVKINNNLAQIGMVAVLKDHRNKNIGKLLMKEVISHAEKTGIKYLILGSQSYVVGFYEKFGFKAYGKEFADAGIPHYMMRLELCEAGMSKQKLFISVL